MASDEGPDVAFELRGGGVHAATQLLAGEFGKAALDLIDSGGRGWCEMDMVMAPPCEPGSDQRGFMGRVMSIIIWISRSGGTCASICLRKSRNSAVRCRL